MSRRLIFVCPHQTSACVFFTIYRNTQRIDLHTEVRYELRPAILFFRAKRRFRGRFGVKNPLQNCIWTYVRNGLSAPKRDMDPDQPLYIFSSQTGIQRSFLDVQSLTGLYTDIRSGRIVYSKTRYVPRTANLFFRAKRGIRGRFVVENSVSNCI